MGKLATTGVLVTLLLALGACSGSGPPPQSVMKPIEERRARGVIEQALVDNGMRPAKGRVVKLNKGAELTEDMAMDGEVYGIAYLTVDEAQKLGNAVPEYQREAQKLPLVPGQGGSITLILYEQNYTYDAGEVHSTNIRTAEGRLRRDVADFVLHAVKQRKHQR